MNAVTARDDELLIPVVDAVLRNGARCADLLDRAPDPDQTVRGMEWTMRELATHLAVGAEMYLSYAEGETTSALDVSDIAGGSLARSSQAVIDAQPIQSLPELATRFRNGLQAFGDACLEHRGSDPVVWHGQPATVAQMAALAISEYLVHGDDLARTLKKPWPIDPDDARLYYHSLPMTLPMAVSTETPVEYRVRVQLRVRGGSRYVLRIENGEGSVGEPDEPVDCIISTDPVAFLLVGYGRRPQWRAALGGKVATWGRKPWKAASFQKYLVTP